MPATCCIRSHAACTPRTSFQFQRTTCLALSANKLHWCKIRQRRHTLAQAEALDLFAMVNLSLQLPPLTCQWHGGRRGSPLVLSDTIHSGVAPLRQMRLVRCHCQVAPLHLLEGSTLFISHNLEETLCEFLDRGG